MKGTKSWWSRSGGYYNNNVWKATQDIADKNPWIGAVLRRMTKIYDSEDVEVPTAGTDGETMYFNSEFIQNMKNQGFLKTLLVHETLHVIQHHPVRGMDRDPARWNIACDAVVNHQCFQLEYPLPDSATELRDFILGMDVDLSNTTAEHIYNRLIEDYPPPEKSEEGEGEGEGGGGDADGDGLPNALKKAMQGAGGNDLLNIPEGMTAADMIKKGDQKSAEARVADNWYSQSASNDPSPLEKLLFERVETIVNWPAELQQYMEKLGGSDFSLLPPNKRLASQGIIANRLNPSGCGNIVVCVDVSGSINTVQLNRFLSELEIIVENIDYESLRLITCDTSVNDDITFSRGEPFDTSMVRGGGGTEFNPAFNLVNETSNPDLLIYFTDLYVHQKDCPEFPPDYPVLWLIDRNNDHDENPVTSDGQIDISRTSHGRREEQQIEYVRENPEYSEEQKREFFGRQWFKPDWGYAIFMDQY